MLGYAAGVPLAPVYAAALAYLLYHPPRRPAHKQPADVGLAVTEHEAETADGRRIHLWLHRGRPDALVVLGHGIGLGKSASLPHAAFLAEAGYSVCLFDHRNHGASGTDRAARRLADRFTDDIVSTVSHLRGRLGYGSARVAVFGFSFSTFPSVYALADPDHRVDAVLCDSGPAADVPELLRNFSTAGILPTPRLFRHGPARAVAASVAARLGTAMLGANWPPAPTGRFATTPMLFLVGGADRIVPPTSSAVLAAAYPRADVQALPDARHLTGLRDAPDQYRRIVLDFLAHNLCARGEDDGDLRAAPAAGGR
ncbi:MAG: alpha/beta fold hydrolase [Streptomycetaceae bacterium]|nr:alpha/beta fold hydrolase [Streptomycetaceae bacterium]